MPYTKRPFEYYGTATNQVLEDLNEANDNFEALAKCFVDDDPLTQKVKDSDKTDGYHASKTPAPNTIPVAEDDGKLNKGWIKIETVEQKTTEERLNLSEPALGQLIFDTDKGTLHFWNGYNWCVLNYTKLPGWVSLPQFLGDFTGLDAAAAFSIGEYGYVGTGWDGSGRSKKFWKFDFKKKVWTRMADFGGDVRRDAVGFAINGYGYIGTGSVVEGIFDIKGTQDFWKYNPSSNSWTQIANFGGVRRYNAVAFVINNYGYVGTGYSDQINGGGSKKDFWRYDPTTNTWTQIANFPITIYSAVAFTIGEYGYVGTGRCDESYYNIFYRYNPSTNSWTQISNYPGSTRAEAVAFVLGNYGYVGLGYKIQGETTYEYQDFYYYDPSSNSWTKISPCILTKGGAASAFTIGYSAFIVKLGEFLSYEF